MMAASGHGSKHTCSNCNNKFYDLNKKPAICPKCECAVAVRPPAPAKSSYVDSKIARQQSSLRRLAAKRSHKAASGKPEA